MTDQEYLTTLVNRLRLRDPPGQKNYRLVSVYPSATELVNSDQYKLSPNVTEGPYSNIDQYLSTHFFLLREDFIKPLRENVITFLKEPNQKLQNVKIHRVRFIRKGVKEGDLCHSLDIREGVTYTSWNLRKDDKRFMTGSLLIFSQDNDFKTILCGRVADDKNAAHKNLLVSFESHVKLKYNQDYLMIECNNFYEPYYNVLKVIKGLNPRNFAMTKYLIDANSSVVLPEYLNGIKYRVSDPDLNKSQLKALNAALSHELVLIQGPPGTGKTFLGLKIAKELLSMSRKWYKNSPMLIISFTNHALDQFLEGLMGATDDILRFGARSKSKKMKNYSIQERRQEFYKTLIGRSYKANISPLFKKYITLEKQIDDIGTQLDSMKSSNVTCVFDFNLLAKAVPQVGQWFQRRQCGTMVSWLMQSDSTISTVDYKNERVVMAQVYENYLKEERKGSKFCMISIPMINKAKTKLKDRLSLLNTKIATVVDVNLEVKMKKEIASCKSINDYLTDKLEYLKICFKTDFGKPDQTVLFHSDPFDVPVRKRWQLYAQWLKKYEVYLEQELDELIDEYLPEYDEFTMAQDRNNLAVMKQQKIIGMTTTMAARMHSTIRDLQCPIVIVEEAAEVLEAHIIPVLTEHCQHLILIGDHKQLRPGTSDYSIETRYKLGVSLFERMVLNDIECHTLNVQHRMRPEISSLITPSIYPELYNHESVERFEAVRGMDKSLFFITHREMEDNSGETSKKNVHEAKYIIQLAVHLLKNGYKPEEITILSTYMGQVNTLTREQAEQADDEVKSVQITSVDNFQGEENKIILLSLVRSNTNSKIGFLSIENRVCVALSRAREGLYIMGNMDQLTGNSKLWKKINASLESQGAVGAELSLKCQRHGYVTKIREPQDFEEKSPTGGCTKTCKALLKCFHSCKRVCHNDNLRHEGVLCMEPCNKLTCKCPQHKCPNKCFENCSGCSFKLPETLACGHKIRCFMVALKKYSCVERVKKTLDCGHSVMVTCGEARNKLSCPECKNWLPTKRVSVSGFTVRRLGDDLGKLQLGGVARNVLCGEGGGKRCSE